MNNLLGAILGFILGVPISYMFFIFKEKRETPRLEYEKISSLSLVSMDERIKNKVTLKYDGTPIDNIFSFKVRVRNIGKVSVENIPIIFQFDDENVEIIDTKADFTPEDKVKTAEYVQDGSKKSQEKVVTKPGLDKNEEGIFEIFTIGNRNADLSSLKIMLGEIQGVEWRSPTGEKSPWMTAVLWIGLGAIVGTVIMMVVELMPTAPLLAMSLGMGIIIVFILLIWRIWRFLS